MVRNVSILLALSLGGDKMIIDYENTSQGNFPYEVFYGKLCT